MVTMFVKSKTRDYDNWKRVYDDFAPKRKGKGVIGAGVFRDADAPDTVTVIHQFTNLAAARAFASGEEIRSAMIESGLEGHLPDIWFTEDVEQTAY